MDRLRLLLLLSFLFVGLGISFASHIVGGYIRYDCLGSSGPGLASYQVTVVLYRDVVRANPQAIFTQSIPLSIFDQGAVRVSNLNLLSTKLIADSIEDPCFVRIDSLELEEGVYQGTIDLASNRDHLLVYQRCCRNSSIDNLVRPTDDWGNTWTIEVPSFNTFGCNSSPDYRNSPPIAFCPNQPLDIDLGATDADGDVLVYKFCAPFSSPQTNPEPNPAFSPPYIDVAFLAPQTPTFPVPSTPTLSFDQNTGRLTGTPTDIGQYVVGFCIEEYRNGVLLSTSRRDIQINTANCNPVILTAVQDQTLLCDGRTVRFENNTPPVPGYNIKGYRWDFGDPNTSADTSRETNPTYRYSDTGVYTITLIANPGLRCSSDTAVEFLVYDSLNPRIEVSGLLCDDSNSVNFIAAGEIQDRAELLWNFGSQATIQSSKSDTVLNVQFSSQQSSYPVSLTVNQDICTEIRTTTISFTPNPIANFQLDVDEICAPFPVRFTNLSTNADTANYIWTFGDGDSAFSSDPSHMYQKNGDYEVELIVQTTGNCIDTVSFTDSVFASRSFSTNTINFGVEPKIGCPPLKVQLFDSSNFLGSARYFWDFDNNVLSTDVVPEFTYLDSGYYDIGLQLITADTCADTLQLTIDSAVRVYPYPTSQLQISEDSVTLKEALISIDASQSENYTKGYLYADGRLIGREVMMDYRFRDTGLHYLDWITLNEFECRDTASSELYIYDEFEFEIPNVFTPNGDGINDAFKVRACGVYDFKIQIYNRYGRMVYTSTSLQEGWDGRINEYKASPGVYFYKILIKDLKGEIKNFEGSLSLLYK